MSIWRRFSRKMGAYDLCSTCVERGVCRNRRRNGQGPRPLEPYRILADDEMRALRKRLHSMFDETWKSGRLKRKESYLLLSRALGIPKEECHFGMFDKRMLSRSLGILEDKNWYRKYRKEEKC